MIRALFDSVTSYPGLFAVCAASGILVPVPEDLPLVYAGVKIGDGAFAWLPTLAVTVLGVGIRDGIAYWAGRLLGDRLLTSAWATRLVGRGRIDWAESVVRDHGAAAVLAGRFLIGFRAPMFAVAGASHVPFRQFLLYNGVGLLVAVPGVVWLGWFFGPPVIDMVAFAFLRTRLVVLAVVVALGAWWLMRKLGR